jgi:chromosome segregation ATPase
LDDIDPHLAPPFAPLAQERTVMGDQYAEIIKELNAKNDKVAFLNAQRSGRDAVIQHAEVHIRTAEAALHVETQQRDVAISMARAVDSGQSAILFQFEQQAERQKVEQAAQASRMTTMYADAERQIFALEHMIRDSKDKREGSSQLLSRSVSAVYALEGETSRLQQTINMHCQEITQLMRAIEEIQQSWNATMTMNNTLLAQLNLVESSFTAEQRDAPARLQEDHRLRNELAMCIGREVVWKQ